MNLITLNYQSDRLILRTFTFLYSAALFLQFFLDRFFILHTAPSYDGLFIFLCITLLINPFLNTKWSWWWITTTIAYCLLGSHFLFLMTDSNLTVGGINMAMPFWVFLTLSAQKWLGPSRTVFLIKFLLLFSYFAGGVAKIRHGFDWMNGWTLQYYFLARHMDLNTPEGWWLFSDLTRAKLLSIVIVTAELLTPLAFFNRKIEWFFVIFYFSFQIACWWLMKLKFMNYYGWSYLIYVAIALVFIYEKYKKRAASGNESGP